jgi:hypothetical protein
LQFKLVLLGTVLLATGLLAYVWIPNVHTTPILQTLPLPSSDPVRVPPGGLVEVVQNLSVVAGRQNALQLNLTTTSGIGQTTPVQLQVFQRNQTRSCLDTKNQSYILNQEVLNSSLLAPIRSSGPYCFVFDNEGSLEAKTIMIATAIISSFEQVQITNDGVLNIVGLVMGALGFLILVAGFMRKTVIPWE